MGTGHGIDVCACGAVVRQCRCPGPHTPRVVQQTCRRCQRVQPSPAEGIDHPAHYGGADNPFEAIKVIESWGLGFKLGNALKYICRAGKKPGVSAERDLRAAAWYIRRHLEIPDQPVSRTDARWIDSDETMDAWGLISAEPLGLAVRALAYWRSVRDDYGDVGLQRAAEGLERLVEKLERGRARLVPPRGDG